MATKSAVVSSSGAPDIFGTTPAVSAAKHAGGSSTGGSGPAVSEIDLSDCFGDNADKIFEELSAFFYDCDGKLMGASKEELDKLCDF